MADLPDTLVFSTLPSTQRCAGGHYRQTGSMSASTHMMPSSFSSIVLTWLLFYHCSSITSTETQRHVRSGSPPQCPAFRLVILKDETGSWWSTALFSSARSTLTSWVSTYCASLVRSTHGLVSAFFPLGRPFGTSRPNTLACGLRKRPGSFLIGSHYRDSQ